MITIKLFSVLWVFLSVIGDSTSLDVLAKNGKSEVKQKSTIHNQYNDYGNISSLDFNKFVVDNQSFDIAAQNLHVKEPNYTDSNSTGQATCPCSNGINIGSPSTTTTLSSLITNSTLPADILYNSCLSISGVLFIDVDYNIFGGEIRMQPGSEIFIDSGNELKLGLINSNGGIHGCEKMWKGITVASSAAIEMVLCTIKDAHIALELFGNPTVSVGYNKFKDNYFGIVVPPNYFQWRQYIKQKHPLIGNYFGCSSNDCELLSPYEDQPIIPGDKAFAGISINEANFIVGSPSQYPFAKNIFENLQVGIMVNRYSKVKVYNTEMYNINGNNNDPIYRDPRGVGIWVSLGWCTIQGNYIDGATAGIASPYNRYVVAKDNTIKNVQDGIYTRASFFSPVIENNTINYKSTGITMQFTTARAPSIKNNTLTVTQKNNLNKPGLDIINVHPAYTDRVENNTFNLFPESTGIRLLNTEVLSIYNNLIDYNMTGAMTHVGGRGIDLSGSSYNYINNNTVQHYNTDRVLGYWNTLSHDNVFCCNEADSTLVGYSFVGMSDDTKFRYNHIGKHYSGFQIVPSTIIGSQFNAGNMWNNTSDDYDASNYGNKAEIRSSRFYVHTCNSPYWPDVIYPSQDCVGPGFKWFIHGEGTTSNCIDDNICLDTLPPSISGTTPNITENDLRLVLGAYDTSEYSEMLVWEKSKHLYRKIVNNPGLYGEYDVIDSFIDNADTPMIRLVGIDSGIRELTNFQNSTLLTTAENKLAYIDEIMKDIGEIDSSLAVASSAQDSADLESERISKIDSLSLASSHLDVVVDSIMDNRKSNVDVIKSANSEINANSTIQQFEKDINKVYLETVGSGIDTLNSNQLNTVFSIANLCPMQYGKVVYRARALYKIENRLYFDDDSLCNSSEELILSDTEDDIFKNPSKLHVWPNPTNNELNVLFKGSTFSSDKVEVYIVNMHGKQVFTSSLNLNGEIQSFNLSKLTNGVYFVYIKSGDKTSNTRKIIITH